MVRKTPRRRGLYQSPEVTGGGSQVAMEGKNIPRDEEQAQKPRGRSVPRMFKQQPCGQRGWQEWVFPPARTLERTAHFILGPKGWWGTTGRWVFWVQGQGEVCWADRRWGGPHCREGTACAKAPASWGPGPCVPGRPGAGEPGAPVCQGLRAGKRASPATCRLHSGQPPSAL